MVGVDPDTVVNAAFGTPRSPTSRWVTSSGSPTPTASNLAILVQGSDDLAPTRCTWTGRGPRPDRGTGELFPEHFLDDPVLVVDTDLLDEQLGASGNPLRSPRANTEYWIKGDPDQILGSLE